MRNHLFVLAFATLAAACSTTTERPALSASSRVCPSGIVRSDAELERYEGCTRVSGDLTVEGVSTLESLSELRQVDGALRIQHTRRLFTLAGLENLVNLSELSLRRNHALINARSLNGVRQVFHVTISENPRLSQSFGLLKGLAMQPDEISIAENAGLDAEGLDLPRTGLLIAKR